MLNRFRKREELAPGIYALRPLRNPEEAWRLLQWMRNSRLWVHPSGPEWKPPSRERFVLGKSYAYGGWSSTSGDGLIEVIPGEFGEGSSEAFAKLVAELAESIANGSGTSRLSLADWQGILGVRPRRRAELPGMVAERPDVILAYADRVGGYVPKERYLCHVPGLGRVYGPQVDEVLGLHEVCLRDETHRTRCLADEISLWSWSEGASDKKIIDLAQLSFAEFSEIFARFDEWCGRLEPSSLGVWDVCQARKQMRRDPDVVRFPGTLRELAASFGHGGRTWVETAQAILEAHFDPAYAAELDGGIVWVTLKQIESLRWSVYQSDLHTALDPLKVFAGLIPLQLKSTWDGVEVIARVGKEICGEMLSVINKPERENGLLIQVTYLLTMPCQGRPGNRPLPEDLSGGGG